MLLKLVMRCQTDPFKQGESSFHSTFRSTEWKTVSETFTKVADLFASFISKSQRPVKNAQHLYSALHGIQTTLKRSGMDQAV